MTVGELLDSLAHLPRAAPVYAGCPGACVHPVRGLVLDADMGNGAGADAVVLESDDDEDEAVER
jgi:hypothetical protein